MAWSATFLADFQQWDQQLRQAEVKLGAFEQSAQKTKNSLQKMTSEFDGTKVIQQAGTMAEAVTRAGGAARLTDTELRKVNATLQEAIQKYQRMGQEAPSSLSSMADAVRKQLGPLDDVSRKTSAWGGALTSVKGIAMGFVAGFTLDRVISGIGNAVTSTISWGAALNDMAAKTGVSTTALQKWEYAAKQGGNTLDQVVTASVELSRRLADGDQSVVAAVGKLGLDFDRLRQLSPEQQFDEVAAAIGRTANQGDRAAAAVDLLGRSGKELLPTLTADMGALSDEAERLGAIVDEQTLKAMADLDDAWEKMKGAGRGLLSEVIAPLIPQMNNLATAASNAAKAFREDFWGALLQLNEAARGGLFAGALFGQRFGGQTPAVGGPGRPPVPSVTTSEFFGSQHGLAGENVVAGVFMRDLVPAARESATALRQVAQSAAVLRDVNILNGSRNGGVSIFQTLANQVPLAQLLRESVVLGGQNNPWGGVGMLAPAGGSANFSSLTRPGFSWGGAGLAGLGAAMPFLSQLTTGGSQGGQIGGSIGGALGGILGSQSLFGGLKGMSGFAGFLGSAAPFMGPILGLVGGLVGKLFGPSRGAVLGKEADARLDQTRAGLLQQYGSLDAIAATGRYGQELVGAWGDKNVAGEAHFNALLAKFQEANGLLAKQKGLESEIAGIEAERKAINDGLVTSWDRIVDITTRYGISIEGLGGQVRQLGATTTWTQMLNDIQALERAGGDVGGILAGMKDEIGELVAESLRLGTEVPENLRPYVQNLFDTGQLLDANGQAITDIANLRWGPSVQTQADIARTAMERLDTAMQTLVDRLNEIIDRLANGLPSAAETGARGANGAINTIEGPDMRGGSVEESFAGGSHGIQDFGAGTLAMLHGREIVQTEAQYRASQAATITASQVVLDKRVIGEILFELLPAVAARRGLVPGMAY